MENNTPGEDRVLTLVQIKIRSRTSFSPLITGQASKHAKPSRHTEDMKANNLEKNWGLTMT
jgi:hypothetical protein